jgi:hypothetical protein
MIGRNSNITVNVVIEPARPFDRDTSASLLPHWAGLGCAVQASDELRACDFSHEIAER